MARRQIGLFNPRLNEWEKGKKYRPADPDGRDVLPERGAGPIVSEVLRKQRMDGLWDWDALPPATAVFPEFTCRACMSVARVEIERALGLVDDDLSAATLAVLTSLLRVYGRHASTYADAVERAMSSLTRRTRADRKTLDGVVRSISEELTRRWKDRQKPPDTTAGSRLPTGSIAAAARLRAAHANGLPVQKYLGQSYACVDGAWYRAFDERRVDAALSATLERLWAQRHGLK